MTSRLCSRSGKTGKGHYKHGTPRALFVIIGRIAPLQRAEPVSLERGYCAGVASSFWLAPKCLDGEAMKLFWRQVKYELSHGRDATLILAVIAGFVAQGRF
jgi:hypothetical protein